MSGELKRNLKSRHLSMIALGGAIGTGIFLAMGETLGNAGPGGALIAYGAIGVVIYFLVTSLGEMATYMPVSGSFSTYASRFIDPALGFAFGWLYWINWAVVVATEMVAGAVIMKYWFPDVPSLYWSALFLAIIVGLNMLSAKAYGESEYWFAAIKVATVIIFLVIGVLMIFGILGGEHVGFKNYFISDGPFHGGFKTSFSILLVAGFSFQGTELIGIAAGESENPEETIPKSIKTVFWRIIIFYLGTIAVLGAIIPFTQAGVTESPFTMVFEKVGIAAAASIMNAVILTSILSAGNSGMYAAGRMLCSMANSNIAPKVLGKINDRGVPVNAIMLTTLVTILCFLCGVFAQDTIYSSLVTAVGLFGFIGWSGIAISHYRFRKAYKYQGRDMNKLKYKANLYPLGPVLVMAMCLIVIVGQYPACVTEQGINWQKLISSYIGLPLFAIFYSYYKLKYKTKVIPLGQVDLDTDKNSGETIA